MKKAVVFNLGCKVNQYECDALSAGLKAMGYYTTESLEPADLYVVNTCAVTSEAERKSRQILARIKKLNQTAEIIVTGCASEKNQKYYQDKGIKYVSGVMNKNNILKVLGFCGSNIDFDVKKYEEPTFLPTADRTRSYVKIQDGCDNFCSYCIIPYLRGRSRSRTIENSVREIENLALNTEEIVITGVNLSQYGKDTGESLVGLINALKNVNVRIRLGSFYVEGINSELLQALKSLKRFCPHFHLSLQNGDDNVLRAMNRRYSTKDYLEKIALIREYFPYASITTDIIVGYPTETEENFINTINFAKEVGFSDIHIFPFSAREGTVAYKLAPIAPQIIKERKAKLEEVRKKLHKNYLETMKNVCQEVVFETKNDEDYSTGYSEYYVRFYVKTEKKVAIVTPTEIYKDGLKGEI